MTVHAPMPAFKFLRYQLRYQNGADPETLISNNVADALRQAKEKSYIVQSTVFLWCEGRLVAECAIPSEKNEKPVSDKIILQLVEAGFYVVGHIPLDTLETPQEET